MENFKKCFPNFSDGTYNIVPLKLRYQEEDINVEDGDANGDKKVSVMLNGGGVKKSMRLERFNTEEQRFKDFIQMEEKLENADDKDKKLTKNIELQLFFSIMKLFANNVHYYFENESFTEVIHDLQKFNNLNSFKFLLNKNYLDLNKRVTILKYILKYYFIDVVKENDEGDFLSTHEYKLYREYLNNKNNHDGISSIEEGSIFEGDEGESHKVGTSIGAKQHDIELIIKKYGHFKDLQTVLDIYIQELEHQMFLLYHVKKDEVQGVQNYMSYITLSMKFISDYFLEAKHLYKDKFSNHMTLHFYKLAHEFLKKGNFIKSVFKLIENPNRATFKDDLKQVILNINIQNTNLTKFENQKIFFDTEQIYWHVTEELHEIDKVYDFYEKFRLERHLYNYDRKVNVNFFNPGLIFEGDFEVFYRNVKKKKIQELERLEDPLIKSIHNKYEVQFIDIKNTNFLELLRDIGAMDINNYRELLADYYISYINSQLHVDEKFDINITEIITKVVYFNLQEMQQILQKLINRKFLSIYCSQLQRIINVCATTSMNFFIQKRFYGYINMKSKLMIQFIQLLGEGFCKNFLDMVMWPSISLNPDKSVFGDAVLYSSPVVLERFDLPEEELINNACEINRFNTNSGSGPKVSLYKYIVYKLNEFEKYMFLKSMNTHGLPNDNLIIMSTIMINFLIEYNGICKSYSLTNAHLKNIAGVIFNRGEHFSEKRKKILLYIKIEYIKLLTSIIQHGYLKEQRISDNNDGANVVVEDPDKLTITKLNQHIVLIDLYEEIIHHMSELVEKLKVKRLLDPNLTLKDEEIVPKLKFLYVHSMEFEKSLELKFCTIAFRYIKMISEIYKIKTIDLFYGENNTSLKVKDRSEANKITYYSLAGLRVYEFLSKIISVVDIRYKRVQQIVNNPKNLKRQARSIKNSIRESIFQKPIGEGQIDLIKIPEIGEEENNIINKTIEVSEIQINNNYNEESETESGGEDESNDNDYKSVNIYYIKPAITFLLSEQSKQHFSDTVDRSSPAQKLSTMINDCDYFLFEMFYNYNLAIQGKFALAFKKIRMGAFELFNYLLVLIHQILLLKRYHKSENSEFPLAEKNEYNIGNLILACIQLFYLTIVIIIWIRSYVYLSYQEILMKNHGVKFITKNEEQDNKNFKFIRFTDNFVKDNADLLKHLNDEVNLIDKAYILLIELLLFNRVINVFVYNFILTLLYIITEQAIFLIIPTLFISNTTDLLYSIFTAVQLKWKQLCLVIIFTYMIVYFFAWISFLYLVELFDTEVFVAPVI
jgi:hypothetical protein